MFNIEEPDNSNIARMGDIISRCPEHIINANILNKYCNTSESYNSVLSILYLAQSFLHKQIPIDVTKYTNEQLQDGLLLIHDLPEIIYLYDHNNIISCYKTGKLQNIDDYQRKLWVSDQLFNTIPKKDLSIITTTLNITNDEIEKYYKQPNGKKILCWRIVSLGLTDIQKYLSVIQTSYENNSILTAIEGAKITIPLDVVETNEIIKYAKNNIKHYMWIGLGKCTSYKSLSDSELASSLNVSPIMGRQSLHFYCRNSGNILMFVPSNVSHIDIVNGINIIAIGNPMGEYSTTTVDTLLTDIINEANNIPSSIVFIESMAYIRYMNITFSDYIN